MFFFVFGSTRRLRNIRARVVPLKPNFSNSPTNLVGRKLIGIRRYRDRLFFLNYTARLLNRIPSARFRRF